MGKVTISIFVAAFIVGNLLYIPFQKVSANDAYLRAAVADALENKTEVQSVILDNIKPETGGAFTPTWERQQYTYEEGDEVVEDVDDKKFEEETDQSSEASEPEEMEEKSATTQTPAKSPTKSATKNPTKISPEQNRVEEKPAPIPAPKPKPEPEPEPEPQKISRTVSTVSEQYVSSDPLVQQILLSINEVRKEKGFGPLSLDVELMVIAAKHSKDMAQNDYLAHTNQEGCTYTCRFEEAGYSATAWAENIGFIENVDLLRTTEATASYMMASWEASKSHRINIENKMYTKIGIGIAKNGDDLYITTDFALPN